jgi:hypothetical protein
MRTLFPGYFQPTNDEFSKLWNTCTFAFDANVLLDLYRSNEESQEFLFSVLERLAGRIFLPHQAAHEYLKNRLDVISRRGAAYASIKADAQGLVKSLETKLHDHELAPIAAIVKIAADAAHKITELADAALQEERKFSRSDGLRARLVQIFKEKIGMPFERGRSKEVFGEASERFAHRIPPGYKDEVKPVPDRYGDVVLWFQIINHAKETKKPVILVTSDSKEDWWLIRAKETLGPRPELIQEMMDLAGVSFYIYTTPEFLKHAQRHLNLSAEATQRAANEFEKIEKQDKDAAASAVSTVIWTDALRDFLNRPAALSANANFLQQLKPLDLAAGLDYAGLGLSPLAKFDLSSIGIDPEKLPRLDFTGLYTPQKFDLSQIAVDTTKLQELASLTYAFDTEKLQAFTSSMEYYRGALNDLARAQQVALGSVPERNGTNADHSDEPAQPLNPDKPDEQS